MVVPRSTRLQLLLVTVILFLIVASRVPRLPHLEPDTDEAWSVWQSLGTPQQIVMWTPADWGPLYYLMLGAWTDATGIYPETARLLSVYLFLIGGAAVFRLARKWYGDTSAVVTLAAYGAFSYGLDLSTRLRGYVLVLMLAPLILWFTVRYFERPTVRRAIPVTLGLLALVYTHPTAGLLLALVGLFSLIMYRGAIWRWWLPGVPFLILALPEAINKSQRVFASGVSVAAATPMPSPGEVLTMYAGFAGWGPILLLWAVLFIVAAAFILYRFRINASVIALVAWMLTPLYLGWRLPGVAVLIVVILGLLYLRRVPLKPFMILGWVAIPLLIYYLFPAIGLSERHLAWLMIGVILWIGWGISFLPRPGPTVATVLLVAAFFWPFPPSIRLNRPPLASNMALLAQNIQPGDALLIDPNCDTVTPDEWYYFTRAYFPQGLNYVTNPEGYRRIWYIKVDGRQDPQTDASVRRGRVEGMFFGPWNLLFRLYEAPPDSSGIVFTNGLRFHGAEFLGRASPGLGVYHEGETIRLKLWWAVDHALDRDYSIGVYILDGSGALLAQSDGEPQDGDAPHATSQWQPGRFYTEERTLTLPNPTLAGRYTLLLSVYQWWDNTRLDAPGADPQHLLPIKRLDVKSF